MKFKKPSESTVVSTLALAGGALSGTMASKAVYGLIDKPVAATADAATVKKYENTAMLKRAGLAAAGFALALFVSGNDNGTKALQGAGLGIAGPQVSGIIATLAKRAGVKDENTATTTGAKAAARALGLGCPDNYMTYAGMQRPGMGIPHYPISNMDVAYLPAQSQVQTLGTSGVRSL